MASSAEQMQASRNGPSRASTPTISVLMPVYNAQAYLAEALDSVLAQTYGDFECICVDDGSTDGSPAILRDYAKRDGRVHVISRANTGIVGALNDALAEARGRYIARMDADDSCHPIRFAQQVAHLNAHCDCVAVGTWVQRTDPTGSPAGEQRPPIDHEAIDAALMQADGGALVHATLMMRAEPLRRIGGWRDQYNWVEDLDLFLRLAEVGRVANLPQLLYTYRRHTDSVCFRNYELMCERLKAVLVEAYARRGRTDVPAMSQIRPELPRRSSAGGHYRAWACHAMHRGDGALARRHALAAVRREPWHIESWRVLGWALSTRANAAASQGSRADAA